MAITACLKWQDVDCLEKHITRDLVFPEYRDFGCQVVKAGKITPYEFALCVVKSKVKCTRAAPKIKPLTLKVILNECFSGPKSIQSDAQIVTRSGYFCRLEEIRGELFLSSVTIDNHLTGFEADKE